jgi:hypothetical protein
MNEFVVLSQENHAGTFNGFMESVALSLEQFIKNEVRKRIPDVVLDHRTPLGKCQDYLLGVRTRFTIQSM